MRAGRDVDRLHIDLLYRLDLTIRVLTHHWEDYLGLFQTEFSPGVSLDSVSVPDDEAGGEADDLKVYKKVHHNSDSFDQLNYHHM